MQLATLVQLLHSIALQQQGAIRTTIRVDSSLSIREILHETALTSFQSDPMAGIEWKPDDVSILQTTPHVGIVERLHGLSTPEHPAPDYKAQHV